MPAFNLERHEEAVVKAIKSGRACPLVRLA
jgi:hypothetical protein